MSNQDSKRLQLLRLLAENPRRSQRELSRHMGVALGGVNYCLSGLIDKGYIKLENFRHADNRLAYAYNLTPDGIEAKLHLTYWFLKLRLKEYTEIKSQIQTLSTELADQNPELLSDLDFKDILSLSPER